ncbi:hypothetical protein BpHYR1_026314 [Brachionus plicatilis]|uniref:Uncharacterized protein n=1 Tax=Brachionus plicatilis TaxID=10195 RepID=A0A3M7RN26_BRAPC|nr:hypothetical protein BpHYR1_026314 [Brachionus plicatilis]
MSALITQLVTKIQALEQEEPLKFPVCFEVYTSERRVVALFCSHMLCKLCHQKLTEFDSSSLYNHSIAGVTELILVYEHKENK